MLQKATVLTAEGYVFKHQIPQSLLKDRNEALFDLFYSDALQIAGKISSLSTRSKYKW